MKSGSVVGFVVCLAASFCACSSSEEPGAQDVAASTGGGAGAAGTPSGGGGASGSSRDAAAGGSAAGTDASRSGDGATTADSAASCSPYGGPPAAALPSVAGTWKLEYQDDFLGDAVDGNKWKVGEDWAGANGIGANLPEDMTVSCGYLTYTAEKKTVQFAGKSYDYASAELSTFKRFRQRYGWFEARLKYDGVRGLWPAFWLMPERGLYGNVDQNRISYIKFDLSSDARASVTSAKLQLYVEAADAGVENVALLPLHDDAWKEGTVTYNTRPTADARWIEMKYDPQWSAGSTVSFDVTDFVNRELAGDKVVSFALVDGFERARHVLFSSKESLTAANRPRLVLSGAPSEVIASEDATVGEGASADQNMGSDPELSVFEDWASTTSTYDGGMEMDIMESLGDWGDSMTSSTVHWDGYAADHQSQGSGHLGFPVTSDGFHTYALDWQPGSVTFYVDGKSTYGYANARVGSVEGYVILSLQMGGWADDLGDNRTPDDAKLPASMVVDYVRVFSGAPN